MTLIFQQKLQLNKTQYKLTHGEFYRGFFIVKNTYNKNISNGSKLLYAEITALTNEKGYCWANNEYFSKLTQMTVASYRRNNLSAFMITVCTVCAYLGIESLTRQSYITLKISFLIFLLS